MRLLRAVINFQKAALTRVLLLLRKFPSDSSFVCHVKSYCWKAWQSEIVNYLLTAGKQKYKFCFTLFCTYLGTECAPRKVEEISIGKFFLAFSRTVSILISVEASRPYPDLHSTVVVPKGGKIPLQLMSVQWAQIFIKIH